MCYKLYVFNNKKKTSLNIDEVEWNNNQIKGKEIIDLSHVFSVWIKIIFYINKKHN